jgi:hypothetical protein
LTEVTSWFDVSTVVVQPWGGSTPAAAKHAVAVTVEELTLAAVTVFVMVTVQDTWNPAPVGKAGGLHWFTAGAVAAAEADCTPAKLTKNNVANAVVTPTTKTRARRSRDKRKEDMKWTAPSMSSEINTGCLGRPKLKPDHNLEIRM